jgi:hypothetical protein
MTGSFAQAVLKRIAASGDDIHELNKLANSVVNSYYDLLDKNKIGVNSSWAETCAVTDKMGSKEDREKMFLTLYEKLKDTQYYVGAFEIARKCASDSNLDLAFKAPDMLLDIVEANYKDHEWYKAKHSNSPIVMVDIVGVSVDQYCLAILAQKLIKTDPSFPLDFYTKYKERETKIFLKMAEYFSDCQRQGGEFPSQKYQQAAFYSFEGGMAQVADMGLVDKVNIKRNKNYVDTFKKILESNQEVAIYTCQRLIKENLKDFYLESYKKEGEAEKGAISNGQVMELCSLLESRHPGSIREISDNLKKQADVKEYSQALNSLNNLKGGKGKDGSNYQPRTLLTKALFSKNLPAAKNIDGLLGYK